MYYGHTWIYLKLNDEEDVIKHKYLKKLTLFYTTNTCKHRNRQP